MPSVAEVSNVPQSQSRGKLLCILGVGFGLAVTIGNTIGAGITRTPGEVAANLPNPTLFIGVWIVGGLYALLGAISLAELGAMLPRSGGQYVFARQAIGEYAGFVVGWGDWLSTCSSSAVVSIVIGEYMGALAPSLAGKTVIIALFCAIGLAIMQWRGLRWGSRFQELNSLFKSLAFIALVLACFILGGNHAAANAPIAPPAAPPLFIGIIVALQSVIYTYDGWTGVIYFSEEVKEPGRDSPRSMFGGLISVIIIYLLVNLAIMYVLPLPRMAGEKLVAGAAASVIFGAHGDTVIRVLTIVSILGSLNAFHLMASRVLFTMSRDGLFWQKAESVNAGGTPTIALFISATVAALFILSGKIERVLAVTAFFFVANYTISFISVFVLRWREPLRARPFRAWGYPWTTGLALICSVLFLAGAVYSDRENSVYALALIAISYPCYKLLKRLAK